MGIREAEQEQKPRKVKTNSSPLRACLPAGRERVGLAGRQGEGAKYIKYEEIERLAD